MFPATYNVMELSQEKQLELSPLNHNHTHFLLVDDGTEKQFGAEIAFRARLEQHFSEGIKISKETSMSKALFCLAEKHTIHSGK